MTDPKVALVAMVKNECDIIELFLRINGRSVDAIYIIDHDSTDATSDIIGLMQAESPTIHHLKWSDPVFRQAVVVTSTVRLIAEKNIFDYVVVLDGDEFIGVGEGESFKSLLARSISATQFGAMPWQTFVPVEDAYYAHEAPLYDCFRARLQEPLMIPKIVLGNEYAKGCNVHEGNHLAGNPAYPDAGRIIDARVQHVPIRSSDQLMRKAILGSYTLAMKPGRSPGEGIHWDHLAGAIRARNYQLSSADLRDLAYAFPVPPSAGAEQHFDESPQIRIGSPDDKIVYRDLARINPIQSFDLYIDGLVKKNQVNL